MEFQPLLDLVLIKPNDQEQQQGKLILLNGRLSDSMEVGIVLSVGPGRWMGDQFVTPNVKAGETVVYGSDQAERFRLDGQDLVVAGSGTIYGVLRAESEETDEPG